MINLTQLAKDKEALLFLRDNPEWEKNWDQAHVLATKILEDNPIEMYADVEGFSYYIVETKSNKKLKVISLDEWKHNGENYKHSLLMLSSSLRSIIFDDLKNNIINAQEYYESKVKDILISLWGKMTDNNDDNEQCSGLQCGHTIIFAHNKKGELINTAVGHNLLFISEN